MSSLTLKNMLLLLTASECLIFPSISQSQSSVSKQAEAERHYRVALIALKNNDLSVADSELTKAVELVPNNALSHYNLAIVESKLSKPESAMIHLTRALELGLPSSEKKRAEDLAVEVDYAIQHSVAGLGWLSGTWRMNLSKTIEYGLARDSFKEGGPDFGLETVCVYDLTQVTTMTFTKPSAGVVEGLRTDESQNIFSGRHRPTERDLKNDNLVSEGCQRFSELHSSRIKETDKVTVATSSSGLNLSAQWIDCEGKGCEGRSRENYSRDIEKVTENQFVTYSSTDKNAVRLVYRRVE